MHPCTGHCEFHKTSQFSIATIRLGTPVYFGGTLCGLAIGIVKSRIREVWIVHCQHTTCMNQRTVSIPFGQSKPRLSTQMEISSGIHILLHGKGTDKLGRSSTL